MGGMIRFHNTLGGQIEEFVPLEPGRVKLYTCGPTVYDFPHIGNWRAYAFEDLLKRFLRYRGFEVLHVMNITDVDDKTIRDSKARTIDELKRYTAKYIDAFMAERDLQNILPADHYPRATEHIPEMVGLVKTLLAKGFAYRKDGSIYFAIDKFPAYGRLSRVNLEERRPGSRGDADEYEKESVHDFALWKAPKEGEPFWETEIGPGRPGWHIECSAMSARYLGKTFDIHCGGVDNIFPHHENEIAQSEAANGVKFVNYWLHCHHLVVDGQKMAKSKGNFFRLADVLARGGGDALDVRYLLVSTHYRKMLDFTFEALKQARTARQRMGDFLASLRDVPAESAGEAPVEPLVEAARAGFVAGLEDDLNIAEALAAIFTLIKNANPLLVEGRVSKAGAEKLAAFMAEVDSVLGVKPALAATPSGRLDMTLKTPSASHSPSSDEVTLTSPEPELSPEIIGLLEERQRARAAKDFKRSDEIRGELLARGIILEDTKGGVRWKRVVPQKP